MALTKPKTLKEKRALQFGIDLLTKYGYGHTVHIPVHLFARELTAKGYRISFMTIMSYWRTLIQMGYATKEMGARINGATYKLNRYAFNKLINAQ